MKKNYFLLVAFSFFASHGQHAGYGKLAAAAATQTNVASFDRSRPQENCNTIVINDTEEQNGAFINSLGGAKAAVDIPMEAGTSMVISQVKVTLSSVQVPTYAHLRFFNSVTSVPDPEDPEDYAHPNPGDILFNVTDTQIIDVEELAFEPSVQLTIRRLTLQLAAPIVLSGNAVDGRYWMGVISDASAWAVTAHPDTNEGVVGEFIHVGSQTRPWSPVTGFEGLYEFTAECSLLGIAENAPQSSTIWPNPANDFLNISLAQGQMVSEVRIYNVAGQQLKSVKSNFEKISVSGLSNGVYFLKIVTKDGAVFSHKFVKQ